MFPLNPLRVARGICRRAKAGLGWDKRNWLRIAQIESWRRFLEARGGQDDVLEISPDWNRYWSRFPHRSYSTMEYPAHDIARDRLDREFDVVIADQVIEHVRDPVSAVMNMKAMLRADGYLLVAAPFLFRVHARPDDFYRWTEAGMREMLRAAGFESGLIHTESWGNRACARAHLSGKVVDFGFGRPMRNEPEFPVMVWAFARN